MAELLTAETVPAYMAAHAAEIGVFDAGETALPVHKRFLRGSAMTLCDLYRFAGAELTATPILGGNVNFAFHIVEAKTGKEAFLKQVK